MKDQYFSSAVPCETCASK